jgi:hypothetical protein
MWTIFWIPPTIASDLPLKTTRQFVADPDGGSLRAGLLTNPLWYAAKWGGFDDENGDGTSPTRQMNGTRTVTATRIPIFMWSTR